jgi:hypothetical protein
MIKDGNKFDSYRRSTWFVSEEGMMFVDEEKNKTKQQAEVENIYMSLRE